MESPKAICQELRTYVERRDSGEYAFISNCSLTKSVECGCEYCDLACRVVGRGDDIEKNRIRNRDAAASNAELVFQQKGNLRENEDESVFPRAGSSGISFSLREYFPRRDDGRELLDPDSRELFVLDRADDGVFPLAGSISGYTGSDEAYRTAGNWFMDCVKEHKILCSPLVAPGGAPKLPLRVVDVGTLESQEVRLVVTENQTGYWACLSYCWGGEQPLKTTRQPDTLTQHIVSISWKSLPKTFQEAIIFARKFGVQFLWVDSLCIIQDDLDDWQAQAAEMAYIYQRSVLTIAGSSSSGPTQGIFRHANPEHLDSPITGSIGQTKLNKIRIRKPLGHDTDELPLLHRCWVHQERLLSPRYLHFGENELIWECMERIRCECGGMRPGRQIFNPTWPTPKDYLHPGVLTHPDWMMRRGPSAWHAVVSDYSGMGLTKAEDIFPAISGLAKIVREATHWQYIAGLWKKSIMVDLVWKTEQPRKAVRCEPWRAPTFSWASIMSNPEETGGGLVSYKYVESLRQGLANRHKWETYFYATLVEAECVPQGEDPTGRLKSGYIILKGTLIRTTMRRMTEGYTDWGIAAIGQEPQVRDTLHEDFNFSNDALHGSKEGDEVFCLKLVGSKKNIKYADEEFLIWLVLKKVPVVVAGPGFATEEENHNRYERIGLLTSDREETHIDEECKASEIERDVLVKIV